jgi:hypothetical protein
LLNIDNSQPENPKYSVTPVRVENQEERKQEPKEQPREVPREVPKEVPRVEHRRISEHHYHHYTPSPRPELHTQGSQT